MKIQLTKTYGKQQYFYKSGTKRKDYSDTALKKITDNLILHLQELKKVEQTNSYVSRRKKILKIRAELFKKENRKKYKRSSIENESRCFEKINKIDKSLARQRKKEQRLND